MVNLLIADVVEKGINSNIVRSISELGVIDHLYMIVGDVKQIPIYEQYGVCLAREKIVQAIYDIDSFAEMFPIDDALLRHMNPHSTEIMQQQQRYENHPDFYISPTWNDHYTMYMRHLFFWYNYLIDRKITHVYFSAPPHEGYDCIVYHLCRYLHIAVRIENDSILQTRRYVCDDLYDIRSVIGAEYDRLMREYANSDIGDIPLEEETARTFEEWASLEPDKMKPWYMRMDPFKRRLRARHGETNIIRLWRGLLGPDHEQYGFGPGFFLACIRKTPQIFGMIPIAIRHMRVSYPILIRSRRLNRFYDSLAQEPLPGEKYIYFPLHYQPEATSNPMGGDMYADQIVPLNILSHALPTGVKIYVKSHPEQLSTMRSEEYYLDMLKIPNVRLMKLTCSTFDLMKGAVAVSTLTGTALWECQFFGIPAIAFGYSLKNLAPLTYAVRTVEDCRKALADIMSKPKQDKLKELKIYTKALHNTSYEDSEKETELPGIFREFLTGDKAGNRA